MNAPDKCPRCGAGPVSGIRLLSDPYEYFTCGTFARHDYTSPETVICVMRQRDQLRAQVETLKAERNAAGMKERNSMLVIVEKWKAYAERLESEGDSLAAYAHIIDFKNWKEAKETKP